MKTRFCPSPTGYMHLGNARTALFSALLTKANGGDFLLRIEDTDQSRSKEEYTDGLMEDLRWLGCDWQEGPEAEKEDVLYYQSQRQEIYDKYYDILEKKEAAYPCFCTAEQLAISRKIQRSSGKPPKYAGTCRHLSQEEIQRKLDQGLKATLRFRVPTKQTIQFHDLVHGRQRFNSDDIGDFIIRRTDGTPAFFYCNALDDALMGVTHVIRGEDHLTNTPRQLLILQALGLPEPEYGHISLIVGLDGSPLSKRHGSKSIRELREMGYLPLALVNHLARLGHYYEDATFMSYSQLADKFSVDNLGKAPARFDPSQLDYWQKKAVEALDPESLWEWIGAETQALIPEASRNQFLETVKPNITFPADIKHWAESLFNETISYPKEHSNILASAGPQFLQTAIDAIDQFGIDYPQICNYLKQTLQVKGKRLFQPLRLALTGELHGPEMAKLLTLMGKEKARQRLQLAMKSITR